MYNQYDLTSILDIPALVKTFAAARGWTTAGTCTLTRPGGGRTFTLSASQVGNKHDITVADDADATRLVKTTSPRLNGTLAAPAIAGATKLHCMGGTEDGTPYIALVIEYGFNLYRHVYIGNMVKVGSYTGGEIISANYARSTNAAFRYPYQMNTDLGTRFLFAAWHFGQSIDDDLDYLTSANGGVNVVHADNPAPWRVFKIPTGANAAWTTDAVFGGTRDGPNDGAVAKGRSAFAGSTILTTPNLWAARSAQAHNDARFVPLGYPAGVRMVSLENASPGDEIEVGTKHYRVFAEFSKTVDFTVTQSGAGWASREASGLLGLAYLVD